MATASGGKGRCLCGQVEVSAPGMSPKVAACHCSMCRRWAGGPLLAVECGSDVSFAGEEHIAVYDSSAWAERGFCRNCGTHLFYRLKDSKEYIVPVGLFDDAEGLVFDAQIFIDEKPAYYRFADKTHDLTGAEVFAKYAP